MKEYSAILVDTSIYDNFGLKLEQGYFASLKQFKNTPIVYLIPDVIASEVTSHIEEKVKTTQNSLEKALKDSEVHKCLDQDSCQQIGVLFAKKKSPIDIATSQFDTYCDLVGATRIDCDDHVSISSVLKQYFAKKPPFGKGKKKNEFPDAIILMATEAWAKENDKQVIAIAKDGDWKNFCETSENIDYSEELPEVFQLLKQNNAQYPYFKSLFEALEENQADDFLSEIETHLSMQLEGVAPDQMADSFLYWEAGGCNGWMTEFSLTSNKITVIDVEENSAIFELSASIDIEVEGEFSLYAYDTIDGDHVHVGGVISVAEHTFESKLLVTVDGDLNAGIEELCIEHVEIVNSVSSVDFGFLEPDYSE
ncbi:PIN domain-containing protein [Vibrio comitans]|uniref:DUF4935 domain-containing protein n=1 Tax=Vibrio comitans NBRC 102076 TaxID=1219078 RepID=A0A4Y3IJH4_9VIBR|nr:PIN domain-containing protein [Vibrio comitans]GEA59162.1 hypothetical protein VCO01S_03550 [Vibrio comitans NBRC 102076]